jgi:hypothetical protein
MSVATRYKIRPDQYSPFAAVYALLTPLSQYRPRENPHNDASKSPDRVATLLSFFGLLLIRILGPLHFKVRLLV